jgi:hypothetical protein
VQVASKEEERLRGICGKRFGGEGVCSIKSGRIVYVAVMKYCAWYTTSLVRTKISNYFTAKRKIITT